MSLTIVKLVPQKLVPESKEASPGLDEVFSSMANFGRGFLHCHVESCQSTFHSRMLCGPIARHKALEIQLVLEQIVQKV